MSKTIGEKTKESSEIPSIKFINTNFLTYEQLTDPDYRLKSLQKLYNKEDTISCSKCHHCR